MVQGETVERLEGAPIKDKVRNLIVDSMKEIFSKDEKMIGLSLCGASAKFEKIVQENFTNSEIFCFENNPTILKKAKKNMPPNCKVAMGNINSSLTYGDNGYAPYGWDAYDYNWVFLDYCGIADANIIEAVSAEICCTDGLKFLAVTFDLSGVRSEGGRRDLCYNLFKWSGRQNWYKLYEKAIWDVDDINISLLKAITYAIANFSSYGMKTAYPDKAIFYKNKIGAHRMVTLIYDVKRVQDENATKANYTANCKAGYKRTEFIEINPEDGGIIHITNGQKDKDPVMVEAGKKAWATREANKAKKSRSDAAKKAWVTRRANEAKRHANGPKKTWATQFFNDLEFDDLKVKPKAKTA